MPTAKEWIDNLAKNHRFGTKQTHGNNNINGQFAHDTVLEAPNTTIRFAAGTRYCIFRSMRSTGGLIIATIYEDGAVVNVYADGVLRRRSVPVANWFA